MTCRQKLMLKLFSCAYIHMHSNRVDSYVDGVTNSLHIMASITSTSITCIMQDVLALMFKQIVTTKHNIGS